MLDEDGIELPQGSLLGMGRIMVYFDFELLREIFFNNFIKNALVLLNYSVSG